MKTFGRQRRRQQFSSNRAWLRPIRRLLSAGVTFWVVCNSLYAQQSRQTEYQVKAAYLYNFGKFISWREEASSGENSLFVCVLGQDPFGKTLDEVLTGASWDGKGVTAKRIRRIEDASECRVLFISSSEGEQMKNILAVAGKLPILTVSDAPEFARRGGAIGFVLSDNRVRFEVNLNAAHRAGLSLSSQLLKVAVRVRGGPQPEER
jgi:hypothetical protein